ncbi:hypothetical protein HY489_06250 [Candidatus Woesearchaeota archaeon]|nr:hypothetical protein [Candidatus Woesearchaeota archaeon]
MRIVYAAVVVAALSGNGCVGPQCVYDCKQRTERFEQSTRACESYIGRPITPNSPEHQQFATHFKIALEELVGTRAITDEQFYELDPDHFEKQRGTFIELYTRAEENHPWLVQAQVIPHRQTDKNPTYATRTIYFSPREFYGRVLETRAPRRRTILDEFKDGLHSLFGWLLLNR